MQLWMSNVYTCTIAEKRFVVSFTRLEDDRLRMVVVLRFEEGIGKGDAVDPVHERVLCKFRVEEEEDGHVDLFARIQPLLLKAKALNLGEVGGYLRGRDVVGGHPDDILRPAVLCLVECQRRLAWQDIHLSLAGMEGPGQRIRDIRAECDANAPALLHRHQPVLGELGGVRHRRPSKACSLANCAVERNRGIGRCYAAHQHRGGVEGGISVCPSPLPLPCCHGDIARVDCLV